MNGVQLPGATSNIFGIGQTQQAYRYAPANQAIPIQKVPEQIIPILIYLMVFQRSFTEMPFILFPLGVTLILTAGFLLSKRSLDAPSKQASRKIWRLIKRDGVYDLIILPHPVVFSRRFCNGSFWHRADSVPDDRLPAQEGTNRLHTDHPDSHGRPS